MVAFRDLIGLAGAVHGPLVLPSKGDVSAERVPAVAGC